MRSCARISKLRAVHALNRGVRKMPARDQYIERLVWAIWTHFSAIRASFLERPRERVSLLMGSVSGGKRTL